MSRWSDLVGAMSAVAKRPSRRTGPARAGAFMPRVTLWVDGERVRESGVASNVNTEALTTPGDTAAALKAIEALAPKPARPGLHGLRVVVGAPFVRYYALPWRPHPKPEQWVSMARMQAVQAGAGAEPWRYAVTDGAWQQGRLAAAMPEALCAGIERLCKTRRLQLLGIEPGFTFAMQKHARHIRDANIAVVELEQAASGAAIAHIGLRRGGGWSGFIALPVAGPLDDVLRDAFVLAATEPPERCYAIGPGAADRWVADATLVEWLAAPWEASP
ncbi:hypothetical protein P9250_22060 [Caballeronia sp. LP006]|uniref:hypothetical protein n=1 Tax=Caballeronia sp. LP006 TaxID=3038552 RepID=UPI00285B4DE5|nr:hypothetical protein [Caballeronia sp. LP006]MDR5830564.1 hypothetical protein [Caballeronia sp. LP006]